MKQIIDAIDGLPFIAKLILAIPMLDVVWNIYRVLWALEDKDTTELIVSIVLFIIPITWIFDILMVVTKGNVWRYKAA